jgi:hypothetical protein
MGILKIGRAVGVGTSAVQRVVAGLLGRTPPDAQIAPASLLSAVVHAPLVGRNTQAIYSITIIAV